MPERDPYIIIIFFIFYLRIIYFAASARHLGMLLIYALDSFVKLQFYEKKREREKTFVTGPFDDVRYQRVDINIIIIITMPPWKSPNFLIIAWSYHHIDVTAPKIEYAHEYIYIYISDECVDRPSDWREDSTSFNSVRFSDEVDEPKNSLPDSMKSWTSEHLILIIGNLFNTHVFGAVMLWVRSFIVWFEDFRRWVLCRNVLRIQQRHGKPQQGYRWVQGEHRWTLERIKRETDE